MGAHRSAAPSRGAWDTTPSASHDLQNGRADVGKTNPAKLCKQWIGRFLAVSASKNNPMKHSFQGTQDVNQSFEQSLCASRKQPRGLTERGPCPSASPLLSCVSLETPWLLRPVVRIGQGTNQTEVRGKNTVMTTSRPLLHHAHHLPHLQRKLLLKCIQT